MKYGFIADVHGNLTGLRSALDILAEADQLVFLGDVTGGREVEECLALLRSYPDILAVPGNHDWWDFELMGLLPESQAYLRDLPLQIEVEDWLALHSDYVIERDFPSFSYIRSESDARRMFSRFPHSVTFFGHTHLSQVYRLRQDDSVEFFSAEQRQEFQLDRNSRYLINVGMASQAAVLFDSERRVVRYNLRADPKNTPHSVPE